MLSPMQFSRAVDQRARGGPFELLQERRRCNRAAAPTRSARVAQRSSRSVNMNARMPSASTIVSFMNALATRKFETSSSRRIGAWSAPAAGRRRAGRGRRPRSAGALTALSSMYPWAASCASASAGAPICATCSRIARRLARVDQEQNRAQLALQRLVSAGDFVLTLARPDEASVVHSPHGADEPRAWHEFTRSRRPARRLAAPRPARGRASVAMLRQSRWGPRARAASRPPQARRSDRPASAAPRSPDSRASTHPA